MSLPSKFINVYYYFIAGQYSFTGDLVIIPETIYFFPRRDLVTERMKNPKTAELTRICNDAVITISELVNSSNYLIKNGLWEENLSDDQFRYRADAHIEKLKQQRNSENFSKSLPIPMRFIASEIKNVRLGFWGRLSFSTQNDDHDFEFGLGKKRLHKVLRENAFIVKDSRKLFKWR